jgi:hypothetical protein
VSACVPVYVPSFLVPILDRPWCCGRPGPAPSPPPHCLSQTYSQRQEQLRAALLLANPGHPGDADEAWQRRARGEVEDRSYEGKLAALEVDKDEYVRAVHLSSLAPPFTPGADCRGAVDLTPVAPPPPACICFCML